MQPQIMRQQKSEQILILKFGFIHVHRKFNRGYATHFFFVLKENNIFFSNSKWNRRYWLLILN
jgi:hypothetical protein